MPGLNGVISSIYEISDEDVAGLLNLPTCAEQLQDVEELAVDISTYGHGAIHWLHVGFL